MVTLKLNKATFELLCECVSWRISDEQAEMLAAERKGLSTKAYTAKLAELDNLKTLLRSIK